MHNVCSKCFRDKDARRFIKKNGVLGDCDFCLSKKRKIVSARELKPIFQQILDYYEPYEAAPGADIFQGDSLAGCMEDWEIFNENLEESVPDAILDAIRGFNHDGDISAFDDWQAKSERWTAIPINKQWEWFAEHLKQDRRFIIESDPSGEIIRPELWVPDLIEETQIIKSIKIHTPLFRGRLGFIPNSTPYGMRKIPLPANQMGPPPPKLARSGRANPEGISFLYCALEEETAIIETGRFPGATVSIYKLFAKRQLRLVNLVTQTSTIDPLSTSNLESEVRKRIFLESLGEALSKPIHPEDSNIEYIPTQYLAEVIRSANYDGICYPSALTNNGTNIVIFDPSLIRFSRVGSIFELGRAKYSIHPNPTNRKKRK